MSEPTRCDEPDAIHHGIARSTLLRRYVLIVFMLLLPVFGLGILIWYSQSAHYPGFCTALPRYQATPESVEVNRTFHRTYKAGVDEFSLRGFLIGENMTVRTFDWDSTYPSRAFYSSARGRTNECEFLCIVEWRKDADDVVTEIELRYERTGCLNDPT